MSTEARALDDVIDDGWEEITKPYSVPAFVAALCASGEDENEAHVSVDGDGWRLVAEVPESRVQAAARDVPVAPCRIHVRRIGSRDSSDWS